MRTILACFLTVTLAPVTMRAETLHQGAGIAADRLEGPKALDAKQIANEIKCGLRGLREKSEEAYKRAEEFAEKFAEIWSTLAELGVSPPAPVDRAHFYSQMLYESQNFLAQIEIDPTKSKIKDAPTWRGRGPIQLSHCANYAALAYFYKNYREGKRRGVRLFDHPPDLWVTVPGKKRPELNCPPRSVANSIIVTAPDLALGNHPLANRFLPALSAIWWWEERKLRSKEFREAVQIDSENAVQLVTFYVKGSTATANRRLMKYNAVRKCVAK